VNEAKQQPKEHCTSLYDPKNQSSSLVGLVFWFDREKFPFLSPVFLESVLPPESSQKP
jgi:hypothetical protein